VPFVEFIVQLAIVIFRNALGDTKTNTSTFAHGLSGEERLHKFLNYVLGNSLAAVLDPYQNVIPLKGGADLYPCVLGIDDGIERVVQ